MFKKNSSNEHSEPRRVEHSENANSIRGGVIQGGVIQGRWGKNKHSGPQSSDEYRIAGEFVGLKTGGDFEVVWKQGSPRVKIIAGSERMSFIRAKLQGDNLVLEDDSVGPWDGPRPYIECYSERLESLDVCGAANVGVHDVNSPKLQAQLSGVSSLNISGKVDAVHWNLKGSVNVKAQALSCQEVEVHIGGSSECDIQARSLVHIQSSGASQIKIQSEEGHLTLSASGTSQIDHEGAARYCHARLSGCASLNFIAAGPCDLEASGSAEIEWDLAEGAPQDRVKMKTSGAAHIGRKSRGLKSKLTTKSGP